MKVKHRQERIQRLEKPQSGVSASFSADILLGARIMLEHALKDRRGNQNPPQNNHQSKHCIGSILLLVAGLESWLNEALAYLSKYDPQFRQKGNLKAIEKYECIYHWDVSRYFPSIDVTKLDEEQQFKFNEIKERMPCPCLQDANRIYLPILCLCMKKVF